MFRLNAPVEMSASYIFWQITSSLCVESMCEWYKKEFKVFIRAQVGSREPRFKNWSGDSLIWH